MNILIYGLQRSGTNYLEKILTDRYQVEIINRNHDKTYPGAKHFRLYDNKDFVPEPGYRNDVRIESYQHLESMLAVQPDYCIVISKDPYSWLESYNKWAAKCKWDKVSHHYIDEYNLFYGKWIELSGQTGKIVFVRYIDLLKDVYGELKQLEKKLGLKKKLFAQLSKAEYSLISQSDIFTMEHAKYYLEERYFANYTQDRLDEINSRLDKCVMSRLGYVKRNNV